MGPAHYWQLKQNPNSAEPAIRICYFSIQGDLTSSENQKLFTFVYASLSQMHAGFDGFPVSENTVLFATDCQYLAYLRKQFFRSPLSLKSVSKQYFYKAYEAITK